VDAFEAVEGVEAGEPVTLLGGLVGGFIVPPLLESVGDVIVGFGVDRGWLLREKSRS